MLKQASALKGASGASGAGNGLLSSAANVASNLGGGAIAKSGSTALAKGLAATQAKLSAKVKSVNDSIAKRVSDRLVKSTASKMAGSFGIANDIRSQAAGSVAASTATTEATAATAATAATLKTTAITKTLGTKILGLATKFGPWGIAIAAAVAAIWKLTKMSNATVDAQTKMNQKMIEWRDKDILDVGMSSSDPNVQLKALNRQKAITARRLDLASQYESTSTMQAGKTFMGESGKWNAIFGGFFGGSSGERGRRKDLENAMKNEGLEDVSQVGVGTWGDDLTKDMILLNRKIKEISESGFVGPMQPDVVTPYDTVKRTKPGLNIITDDITRIGGSIGGGMDSQRAMANSLSSIDSAVAAIRSAVTSGNKNSTPFV